MSRKKCKKILKIDTPTLTNINTSIIVLATLFTALDRSSNMEKFDEIASMLKAVADPVRMRIIDMLSCMELCANSILKGLSITQPTLSHHISILQRSNIITSRKKRTLIYYSINQKTLQEIKAALDRIRNPKDDCVCYSSVCACQNNIDTKKIRLSPTTLKHKAKA